MKSIKRQTVLLFGIRLLKAVVAAATLFLSARYFGVSVERDTWILAFNTLILIDLMLWGAVNETFRAKFIERKELIGKQSAASDIHSVLLFTTVCTVVLSLAIYFFALPIAGLIAPGLSPGDTSFLVFMISILAPSFLFNQVNSLMTGILNAYGFFLPRK